MGWAFIIPLAVVVGWGLGWVLVEMGVEKKHVKTAAAIGGGLIGMFIYWWAS